MKLESEGRDVRLPLRASEAPGAASQASPVYGESSSPRALEAASLSSNTNSHSNSHPSHQSMSISMSHSCSSDAAAAAAVAAASSREQSPNLNPNHGHAGGGGGGGQRGQRGQGAGAADASLDEQGAIRLERRFLHMKAERLREMHPECSNVLKQPIGLALSGGGTRAAAFHTGLMWSLASDGLLKDIGHICAVSGGGYTAASYVTHLAELASTEPPERGALDAWYQKVAARFILRMQRNINYLVDTTPERQWKLPRDDLPEDRGSSSFPRIFDFPLFIGALLGSMTAAPLLLLVHTLWAMVFAIEIFQGNLLRRAWCDPLEPVLSSSEVKNWIWRSSLIIALIAFSSIFLAMLIGMGLCSRTEQRHRGYLFSRSIKHILERAAVCYSIYILCTIAILTWQQLYWGAAAGNRVAGAWVRHLCGHYVANEAPSGTCFDLGTCDAELWYTYGNLAVYENSTFIAEHCGAPEGAPSWDAGQPFRGTGSQMTLYGFLVATLGASGVLLLSLAVVIWRGQVFKVVFTVIIPVAYFCVVSAVAKWKVYGPISVQYLLPGLEWTKYSPGTVNLLFWICLVAAIVTLPVYDSVQKLAHMYYRRALKRAFFVNGRDISFSRLRNCAYCPNILFGACLHDYRKPWDNNNHIDFTMSTYTVGCERTGFFHNPPTASLARMMTIAGAATDATFLLNADVLAVRLILAVIALRFGDFLRLLPEGQMPMRVESRIQGRIERQASRMESQMPRTAAQLQDITSSHQHWISRWLQGLLDRLPAACPFLIAHVLLFVGVTIGGTNDIESKSCWLYPCFVYAGLCVYFLIAVLSFFAYFGPLQWLMRSPMIQQFQMLFMHRYKADKPPPYLYISDGGLIEPLGIFPLLRRRLRRIVVSDAAEDPTLTMRCFRDALKICRAEKLCSFYDPADPHRDMEFVFQDFSDRGDSGFFHLGIRYEPGPDGTCAPDGELFCLRMRLLEGDAAPVRELLTEDELLGVPPAPGAYTTAGLHHGRGADVEQRSEFGGACCPAWECGGLLAGRRFPNFGVGNQFLTPLHFANLCQLGAELSRPLVARMKSTQ